MAIALLVITTCIALLLPLTDATNNSGSSCGKLNVEQVFNETLSPKSDEFPWFGRVFFRDFDELSFRCLGVLVTKRHLLSPAHCYIHNLTAELISLGDSGNNQRNFTIGDIAIHPNFDRRRRVHDIAVIQLNNEVEFSPYIQPICLPPVSTYTDELLGQYFTYGGYGADRPSPKTYSKMKSVAHVMQPERCSEIFKILVPGSFICATSSLAFNSLSGSALMGVNVGDSELQNYYLIALATAGGVLGGTNVEILVRVSSHMNWISSNINTEKDIAITNQEMPNVSRFSRQLRHQD